jgi:predicted RNase H-like HicB family nuclease
VDETELMARRLTGGLPDEIEARAQPLGQAVVRVDHAMHERGEEVTLSFAGGDLTLTSRADLPGVIEMKWLDPTTRMLVAAIMETVRQNPEPADGLPLFDVETLREAAAMTPGEMRARYERVSKDWRRYTAPGEVEFEGTHFVRGGRLYVRPWHLHFWNPRYWLRRLRRWWRGDDLREQEAVGIDETYEFPDTAPVVVEPFLPPGDFYVVGDPPQMTPPEREVALAAARADVRQLFDEQAPPDISTEADRSLWHGASAPFVEEMASLFVRMGGVEVVAGYGVIFEEGEDSCGARVPLLPGCVAVGESREEARALIAEAIPFHIEGQRVDEGAPPVTYDEKGAHDGR